MDLILILFFLFVLLGFGFIIAGILAFVQMRKYYKSLTDFNYYDCDFSEDGDD